MRHLALTATALSLTIAFTLAGATASRADANAPVCAMLYGLGGAFQECNFFNYEQCQATILGRGGSCFDNPTYRESLNRTPQRARSQR